MRPSLLDRLLDDQPELKGEPVLNRGLSYGQLRTVVERDLEQLLNTRCFPEEIPEGAGEVRRSLQVYGLADFSSKNPSLPVVRSELRHEIERAVTLFEPRLRNVGVRLESPGAGERRLKFKITAQLQMEDDLAEPVSFEAYFDSNRGEYSISRQR